MKSLNEGRFRSSGLTSLTDRFMNSVINVGGISVIVAVMGIFLFITWKILPLFRTAKVTQDAVVQLPVDGDIRILGVDEWTQLPFVATSDHQVHFIDLLHGGEIISHTLDVDAETTALDYSQKLQALVAGTEDGRFFVTHILYKASTDEAGKRQVTAELEAAKLYPLGTPGHPVELLSYGESADGKLKVAAGAQEVDGTWQTHITTLAQKRSLTGTGKIKLGDQYDLTQEIHARPTIIRVSQNGDRVLVADETGEVVIFIMRSGEFILQHRERPFADQPDEAVASMNFLLGDSSVCFTNAAGMNRVFAFYSTAVMGDDGETQLERRFAQTKDFPNLPSAASSYAASLRNKAFLVTAGNVASLRYGTTSAVRWTTTLDYTPIRSTISSKYDQLLLLGDDHNLHIYTLDDPHPEAGLRGFFGKIWYEGQDEADYVWQSGGGSDDVEAKLSMVPLVFGTLKGTLYAMLFALPISLFAALYTSQFMHPNFKRYVKPTMEIMASLPSVVLGFIGALWLAPKAEMQVPAIIAGLIIVPGAAVLFGVIWARMPQRYKIWCRPGYEFLLFIPIAIAAVAVAYGLGDILEATVFGGDFRTWWRTSAWWSGSLAEMGILKSAFGFPFEQRNSLLVGFMMAFAVIPIIFSIAEDSMSNVPKSIISASLALGASRWQTAIRVVLPTAAAGIFSAVMIGVGRAVGETMVVLMLCGNTAIREWNIFNGMRPLSSNIAVELPEAPVDTTLYRALFLGGFLLFVMTFFLNTAAEILRSHLRNKYKTV